MEKKELTQQTTKRPQWLIEQHRTWDIVQSLINRKINLIHICKNIFNRLELNDLLKLAEILTNAICKKPESANLLV